MSSRIASFLLRRRFKKKLLKCLPLALLLILSFSTILLQASRRDEVLARIPHDGDILKTSAISLDTVDASLQEMNSRLITVFVDGKIIDSFPIEDLGLSFRLGNGDEKVVHSYLTLDRLKWNRFIEEIGESTTRKAIGASLSWSETGGWKFLRARKGAHIRLDEIDSALDSLIEHLKVKSKRTPLFLKTISYHFSNDMEETRKVQNLYKTIRNITTIPITLKLGESETLLDLASEKDFIQINQDTVSINKDRLLEWLENYADKHYRAPNEVRITGMEEVRPGVNKAIFSGEFQEGVRVDIEEIMTQILQIIENKENRKRLILVTGYEIPVRVYSEIEQAPYELLSVGYSEYSHGNTPARVHNIQTGLDKVNATIIMPGEEISFNRITGTIGNEYKLGWGIFGSVAKPVLGGGICQVSTTFYRALINIGLPILQRQNHSWDLSYYQAGGYGLDATIYPDIGLDIKARNDLDSQLLFYSYTRPETEEAFVLIYGIPDGRKVTLEPKEEYIPRKGPKTLEWTQRIEYPNGAVKENLIRSKYRS